MKIYNLLCVIVIQTICVSIKVKCKSNIYVYIAYIRLDFDQHIIIYLNIQAIKKVKDLEENGRQQKYKKISGVRARE